MDLQIHRPFCNGTGEEPASVVVRLGQLHMDSKTRAVGKLPPPQWGREVEVEMGDVDEKEQEEEQQQEDEKEDAEEEDEDEDGLFPVRRATLRPATKPTSRRRRATHHHYHHRHTLAHPLKRDVMEARRA